MIRRIVGWILYFLRIKARDKRPALEQLLGLLPVVFTSVVTIGIVNSLHLPEPSRRQGILYSLRYAVRRWRMVIVGY